MPNVAPEMSLQVDPPSVDCCHCTVGGGPPLAAAVKVAVVSRGTVWLVGWVVMDGATSGLTLSAAGLVTASGPVPLVKTASYSLPFSATVAS